MPEPAVVTPPPVTPPVVTPPAAPWYEGKADAETIGHWQNKGYDISKPDVIAIEVTKAARELQRHFGVPPDQLLKLPNSAADEAGWKAVHSRLGVPTEAKDYDLATIKWADGTDLEPGFVDMMRASLHKANVAKDRATDVVQSVVKWLGDADKAEAADTTVKRTQERERLLREWGNNAEFNRLTAMQGARRLGVNEEDVARFESILGYDRTMEIFRKIGAGTSEDTFVQSGQGGNPTTANGAAARRAELMADQGWAERYLKGGVTERREMEALNTMIAGAAA
jgi:hypothetical protein